LEQKYTEKLEEEKHQNQQIAKSKMLIWCCYNI